MVRATRLAVAAAALGVLAGSTSTALGAAPVIRNVSNSPTFAEGEQTVAVNPTNSGNIIVGSNQMEPLPGNPGNEPLTTGGVRTWAGGRMDEGGLTREPIAQAVIDALGTNPVPSEFGEAGNLISADQNTVFDRDGHAWYQCINFGVGTDADPSVMVYRSDDGGKTWGAPVKAFSEVGTGIQIDRSFLAIDDSGGPRDGTLYLTFETMFYQAYLPEVYVRSSHDDGKTWGPIVRVDDNADRAQWDPRQFPVVGADGTLHVVYDAAQLVSPTPFDPSLTPLKLMVASSKDGGQTFTRHEVEPLVDRAQSPDEAFFYFTETIAAIAADPGHAERLAVAWPDDRSGEARILMRSSADGGATWSPIVDVADDPAGKGNQHDHVALDYLPGGRLVAVWRDRRAAGGSFDAPLQVFARVFEPSADGRLIPGVVVPVSGKSQPPTVGTHGSMPTEYLGMDASGAGVDVAWDRLVGALSDNVYARASIDLFGGAPASVIRAPVSRFLSRPRRVSRHVRLELRGTSRGRDAAVRRVDVAVARLVGRRCRFVGRNGRLGSTRRCDLHAYLRARGRSRWRLRLLRRLPPGRYRAWARATDANRHREHPRNRAIIMFRVV
jgi:hypothetical protein